MKNIEINNRSYEVVNLSDILDINDFRIVLSTISNGHGGLKQNPIYNQGRYSNEIFFSVDNKDLSDLQNANNNLKHLTGFMNINNFIDSKRNYMCEGRIGSITFINWGEYYLLKIEDSHMIASYKCLVKSDDIIKMFYKKMK